MQVPGSQDTGWFWCSASGRSHTSSEPDLIMCGYSANPVRYSFRHPVFGAMACSSRRLPGAQAMVPGWYSERPVASEVH